VWSPVYIPSQQYYDATPQQVAQPDFQRRVIQNDSSYTVNPDIGAQEVPPDTLPVFSADVTTLARNIDAHKTAEQLNESENVQVHQVMNQIDVQHRGLLKAPQYQRWFAATATHPAYAIVPDMDRQKFVWVKVDANQQV
jgi:hypothetical protein